MQPLDTHWCNYCYQVGAFCPKRGASGSIVKGLTLLEESLATANFVEFLLYKLQLNSFLSEVERRGYRPSLPAHPERRRRCRGIAPAECLQQTGVEFSEGATKEVPRACRDDSEDPKAPRAEEELTAKVWGWGLAFCSHS